MGQQVLGEDIPTDLADLRGLTVDQVMAIGTEELAPYLAKIFEQVEKPRFNLGSGPPGRAD